MPLNFCPVREERFQSVKAMEKPNRVGKIAMATVNSAAGRMKSALRPAWPRLITSPIPRSTAQAR